ncbi:putative pao retrotransposon peptidase superfamily [Trichonephila clavata]|uniref:Putative pao retrotransposon peptidase superfamily n=1 Tax=Trichonephila clavata TaxID=2740835 RepID=A0A8X6G000_TRICU|nr:putative pao retrotransposon peptidase superfamily [Trichonephila clavata]
MGAIVAARLCKYLLELFSDICSEIHLWSDSSIVIYWIPQERQLIRKINRCLACKETLVKLEGITWKFIVELAPWWGGFYERLMRSFKEPLRKIIGRANLTFEETMTILAEIENVLNHRPLITFLMIYLILNLLYTQANFLLVGHKNDYPFNFSELLNNSITRESLLKRKYYQTKLLSQFWKKWKDNYLLNIRSFYHFPKPSVERNLRVGDVVILEGNTKSKFLWDLGRIAKVMQGRDGLVRSCVVKTTKGEFKRPVQLIYPLELSET